MDRVEGAKDLFEAIDIKIDSKKVLEFITDLSVGVVSSCMRAVDEVLEQMKFEWTN